MWQPAPREKRENQPVNFFLFCTVLYLSAYFSCITNLCTPYKRDTYTEDVFSEKTECYIDYSGNQLNVQYCILIHCTYTVFRNVETSLHEYDYQNCFYMFIFSFWGCAPNPTEALPLETSGRPLTHVLSSD